MLANVLPVSGKSVVPYCFFRSQQTLHQVGEVQVILASDEIQHLRFKNIYPMLTRWELMGFSR